MLNPELIRALVDDRERAVHDHLRQRLLLEGRARWVRLPPKRTDRR
ncbi:MAG TPA: hypothetical protein VEW95_04375 [Candidatus Limnocylindrales bacterium]|nr:hypothetical protein [Candidatus Limnocylindrales bacterium]